MFSPSRAPGHGVGPQCRSAAAPWSKPSAPRAAPRSSPRPTCAPPGACERLIAETIERLGGLDVLVNNAGILYTANALDTSDAQWLDTMAVNVNALFYLSRAAVKHMKAAGKGASSTSLRNGA